MRDSAAKAYKVTNKYYAGLRVMVRHHGFFFQLVSGMSEVSGATETQVGFETKVTRGTVVQDVCAFFSPANTADCWKIHNRMHSIMVHGRLRGRSVLRAIDIPCAHHS